MADKSQQEQIREFNRILFDQMAGPPVGWYGVGFIEWFTEQYGRAPEYTNQEDLSLCNCYVDAFVAGWERHGGDREEGEALCSAVSPETQAKLNELSEFTRQKLREDFAAMRQQGKRPQILPIVPIFTLPDEPAG